MAVKRKVPRRWPKRVAYIAVSALAVVLWWRVLDSEPASTAIEFAPDPVAYREGMAKCVMELRLSGQIAGDWRAVKKVCDEIVGRMTLRCVRNCPAIRMQAPAAPKMSLEPLPAPRHQPPRST